MKVFKVCCRHAPNSWIIFQVLVVKFHGNMTMYAEQNIVICIYEYISKSVTIFFFGKFKNLFSYRVVVCGNCSTGNCTLKSISSVCIFAIAFCLEVICFSLPATSDLKLISGWLVLYWSPSLSLMYTLLYVFYSASSCDVHARTGVAYVNLFLRKPWQTMSLSGVTCTEALHHRC